MMCVEMKLRPDGNIVNVYDITDGIATIWDKSQFMRSDQGWTKVKVSRLVPMEYDLHCKHVMSNTSKNKARKRMKLLDATWMTSDGKEWDHKDIESALAYELELMQKDNESQES